VSEAIRLSIPLEEILRAALNWPSQLRSGTNAKNQRESNNDEGNDGSHF